MARILVSTLGSPYLGKLLFLKPRNPNSTEDSIQSFTRLDLAASYQLDQAQTTRLQGFQDLGFRVTVPLK